MKKVKRMLGIDLGASSGRGIVGGYDGERLSLREVHRFPNEPQMLAGRFTWDIVRLFAECKNAVRAAGGEISSIGIDTWGVDYGLLDARGRLLSEPVHYRDGRNAGAVAAFDGDVMPSRELYRISGIQLLDFNTVYQLCIEKREGGLERAGRMLFIPDLLAYFLTGEQACEYTIASTGALLDARKRCFSSEILNAVGVGRELFAPLVTPGTVLGRLLPEVETDVGGCGANVISIASHDTASAVLAVPAKENENFIYISSGTWSLLGTELTEPVITSEAFEGNFTNEGGVGGRIRFLKNIMGLWLLQESRRKWRSDGMSADEISFAALSTAAEHVPSCRSIIDPDDPIFAPPGDMPQRIVDYCKRTGQYAPSTPGEIVRVIYDSLALCYRRTIDGICRICGISPSAINIVGGGSRDSLLDRITANICGLPVIAGPAEATAVGNIAVQLMSSEGMSIGEVRELVRTSIPTETYHPDPNIPRESFDAAYATFCALAEKREARARVGA